MVINFSSQHSIINQIISELRDEGVQRDSFRFRKNMEHFGELIAYEISKTLVYEEKEVTTSLGTTTIPLLKEFPVLATILRAGLPLHQGLLNLFDKSDNAFVSAYREYLKDEEFNVVVEYSSSPELTDRVLVVADPMLATGYSMVNSLKALFTNGKPRHTHIVSIVASMQGIAYLKRMLPHESFTLWVGAIDEELTAHGYIVPGLGDAGDLAYGKKS